MMLTIFDCIYIKFGQILVQLETNIFNLLLPLLQRLETSSWAFYDFDKMATQCWLLVDDAYYFRLSKYLSSQE